MDGTASAPALFGPRSDSIHRFSKRLDLRRQLAGAPRDPFFLITTDGGKTWRERPIFEETRVAAIERFSFDTPTDGELLIDARLDNGKRENYATHDGGETWLAVQPFDHTEKLKPVRTAGASAPTPRRTATSSKNPRIIVGKRWPVSW